MEDEVDEINPPNEVINGSKGIIDEIFNAIAEPNDPAMDPTNDYINGEHIPGVRVGDI